MLEPCYDSYVPNIELAGGKVVRVPLTPGTFRPDFDKIAAAITPENPRHPHQQPAQPQRHRVEPRGHAALQDMLAPTDVLLISDEVYEHMVFDGQQHESAARYPGLAARAFIVSSFGKTYHVTGWKVGYRGRTRRAERRVPQGAPVQRVHRQHAYAVRPGQLHGRPAALHRAARVLPTQARPVSRRLRNTRFKLLPTRAAISSAWTSAVCPT